MKHHKFKLISLIPACLVCLTLFFTPFQSVLAQNIEAPHFVSSWKRVPCPFDSTKALLPVICGSISLPENYGKPENRMIEIAFMIVKTQNNIDPDNPVIFINGGPGGSSLYFAEELVTNPLVHDVVVDRDWVFFDQRGTGRSKPSLFCPDEKDNPFDPVKCLDDLKKQGIDLSQYNSARSASDMEALRLALGVKQWNLWGLSYGSRLAMTMARYYPSSVRSIVHDAPDLPGGQELIDDARGTDAALNRLFEKCADDPECSDKFPQLQSRFMSALVSLRQQPLIINGNMLDDASTIHFIRNWLYPRGYSTYEHRIQNLLIFMDAVARKDEKLIVETKQRMREEEGLNLARPPIPQYGQLSLGHNLSVYCNEKKPFESMVEYKEAIANSEIVSSLLDGFGGPSDCDFWPSGHADSIENTPVSYNGPQLIFTGELDASSSGLIGERMEELYENAMNIVFTNGMHGQFPTELPNSEDMDYWKCALKLAHQFFNDPNGKLDTGCAATRQLSLTR